MSSKREVKRAVHEFVADLVAWEWDNNQSDAGQDLINRYGVEAVHAALGEVESYHARLAGLSSAWRQLAVDAELTEREGAL